MSTRANIIIQDESTKLFFYRHSDGYPSETGESLKEFVKGYGTQYRHDAMQSAGWLVLHGHKEYGSESGWKVGAYEPTQRLHGDVEYVYIIDLKKRVLSCRQTSTGFWDNATQKNTKSCAEFPDHKFGVAEDL